jgi:hypothetical protein
MNLSVQLVHTSRYIQLIVHDQGIGMDETDSLKESLKYFFHSSRLKRMITS